MTKNYFHRPAGLLCTVSVVLTLAGCAAVGPADMAELPELPAQFAEEGTQPLPDRWWRHFDDPRLDRLIERSLADNFSLQAARARLRQAWASARVTGAAERPTLDLRGSGNARRAEGEATQDSGSLGAAAGYELDLWGRLDAATDAARFDAAATRAQLEAAAISLSAETAATYYQLLEQQGVVDLLRAQLDTNQKVLELVELRFRNGRASADEVLRQQQLIEQTEASLVTAEAAQTLLRHRLAVLLGRTPGSLALAADAELVAVPPLPATGLPAEWLRRRPDLREAYLRLQAADARLASAVAAQYPRIDLAASLESATSAPADVFSGWVGSLAASLVAPVFDGGRRRAEVERSEAVRAEALRNYGQTTLEAMREVEDALLAERRDRALLERLTDQVERSQRIVDQLQLRYLNGSTDYLNVLSALSSQQQLSRDLLAARWALVQDRITLARALAGGWDSTVDASPLIDGEIREQNHAER